MSLVRTSLWSRPWLYRRWLASSWSSIQSNLQSTVNMNFKTSKWNTKNENTNHNSKIMKTHCWAAFERLCYHSVVQHKYWLWSWKECRCRRI
jgi:hypothetical protein